MCKILYYIIYKIAGNRVAHFSRSVRLALEIGNLYSTHIIMRRAHVFVKTHFSLFQHRPMAMRLYHVYNMCTYYT